MDSRSIIPIRLDSIDFLNLPNYLFNYPGGGRKSDFLCFLTFNNILIKIK